MNLKLLVVLSLAVTLAVPSRADSLPDTSPTPVAVDSSAATTDAPPTKAEGEPAQEEQAENGGTRALLRAGGGVVGAVTGLVFGPIVLPVTLLALGAAAAVSKLKPDPLLKRQADLNQTAAEVLASTPCATQEAFGRQFLAADTGKYNLELYVAALPPACLEELTHNLQARIEGIAITRVAP